MVFQFKALPIICPVQVAFVSWLTLYSRPTKRKQSMSLAKLSICNVHFERSEIGDEIGGNNDSGTKASMHIESNKDWSRFKEIWTDVIVDPDLEEPEHEWSLCLSRVRVKAIVKV